MAKCARCDKETTGRYCKKCHSTIMKENRKKWSLPGGREEGQKDDPMPSSNVSGVIQQLLEEQAQKINRDARARSSSHRTSLDTIDADPDAFRKATDQD